MPHAPQFAGSLFVAMQAAPHVIAGAMHWHVPPVHVFGLAQALPHAPHDAADVSRFVSQPLVAIVSQSAKRALQLPISQTPLEQAAVAFATVHTFVQPPQCIGSPSRSASQPFAALPSQSANPRLHVNPQAPAVHVAAAFAGTTQALPHAPQ